MEAIIKRANLIPLSFLGALAFFTLLWALDFPKPWMDDLFYTGAAFNMTTGGDFSNPLLVRQEFPGHYFFVYPPFHSYALAGWFKIFGISASAATGFQILMYLVIAVATIAILRKHKAPAWMEWLVPLGVSTALLAEGLRPEPLSLALTMAGFALVECGFSGLFSVFAAFLLLFLGGGTAPRMTVFSAVLVFAAAFRLWQGSKAKGWQQWRFCIPAAAALLVVCIAFLWMIHFRMGEFWTTFHYHKTGAAARAGGTRWKLLLYFLNQYSRNQWPLLLLPVGFLLAALKQPKDRLAVIGLLIAAAFPVVALIGGLGRGTLWYIVFISFLLGASLVKRIPRPQVLAVSVMMAIAVLAANKNTLFEVVGQATGHIKKDQREQQAVAAAVSSTPAHALVVDTVAARYVYDYRLPPGCVNLEFSSRFPLQHVVDSALREGDVYLAGRNSTEVLRKVTYLENTPKVTRWMLFGSLRWSADDSPDHIEVITAENCKGLRPADARLK